MTLLPLSSPTSTVIDMCQTKNGASVLWGQTCTGWVHGRLRLGTQGILSEDLGVVMPWQLQLYINMEQPN